MPPQRSEPLLPVQLGANDPPTDAETEDSDDTVFYPDENTGDALLIIDEAEWRGLSDNHRMASNTASFSFVTSMEGAVQDISELSTTPATYTSLFSGLGEPRVSGRRQTMYDDDPQMVALSLSSPPQISDEVLA